MHSLTVNLLNMLSSLSQLLKNAVRVTLSLLKSFMLSVKSTVIYITSVLMSQKRWCWFKILLTSLIRRKLTDLITTLRRIIESAAIKIKMIDRIVIKIRIDRTHEAIITQISIKILLCISLQYLVKYLINYLNSTVSTIKNEDTIKSSIRAWVTIRDTISERCKGQTVTDLITIISDT